MSGPPPIPPGARAEPPPPPCPTCGTVLQWVPERKLFLCVRCQRYQGMAQPAPGPTKGRSRAIDVCATVGVVALALGFGAPLLFDCPSGDESSSTTSIPESERAYNACKEFVKRQLKAPGSAKFTGEYYHAKLGDGSHRIRSVVDAQNSFGALIRNKWICVVAKDGDDWKLTDIKLLPN